MLGACGSVPDSSTQSLYVSQFTLPFIPECPMKVTAENPPWGRKLTRS